VNGEFTKRSSFCCSLKVSRIALDLDFLIPTKEVVSPSCVIPLDASAAPLPNHRYKHDIIVQRAILVRAKEAIDFLFIASCYHTSIKGSKRLVDNYARINLRILLSCHARVY
jgi:hypothetical protein